MLKKIVDQLSHIFTSKTLKMKKGKGVDKKYNKTFCDKSKEKSVFRRLT